MANRNLQFFGSLPFRNLSYRSIGPVVGSLKGANMATIATYKVPKVENESNVGEISIKTTSYLVANAWES